jgi:hypothetical protein
MPRTASIFARGAVKAALWAPWPQARPLFDARRSRTEPDSSSSSVKEDDFDEGTLVLVRHGQSEWNLKNLFTGWRDVDLTEQWRCQGGGAARLKARGLKFDIAFTSVLKRAQNLPAHPRRGRPERTSRRSATQR